MMKCEICGKEYKRQDFFDKHMATKHPETLGVSPQEDINTALLTVLKDVQEQMTVMRAETVAMRAQIAELSEKETPEESRRKLEEIKGTIDNRRAEKIKSIEAAPVVSIMGVGDDDGNDEVVKLVGKTWTIKKNVINEVPKPVAGRCIETRERRAERDQYAEQKARRVVEGPRAREDIEAEVAGRRQGE